VVKDVTASYSDQEMHAAMDINISNYSGDRAVDAISSF
jgi:hypothetical protein